LPKYLYSIFAFNSLGLDIFYPSPRDWQHHDVRHQPLNQVEKDVVGAMSRVVSQISHN
jgi:hypothetical protein